VLDPEVVSQLLVARRADPLREREVATARLPTSGGVGGGRVA